jgi:hypothetical protein
MKTGTDNEKGASSMDEFTHDDTRADRAEILIRRALNCGWITVQDRDQLKANIRVALDQEVRSGGPYVEGSRVEQLPCPCQNGRPCHDRCTCLMPLSSSGCRHCCRYGSKEQREAMANRIADALAAFSADQGAAS